MSATDHPNVQPVGLYLEAWSQEDPDVLLQRCAGDIVVHVGGRHQLSGTYRGPTAVTELHAGVRQLMLQIQELEEILADDEHAAAIFRFNAGVGEDFRATCAVAMKLDDDGKVAEAWFLLDDQAAGDSFVQRQHV